MTDPYLWLRVRHRDLLIPLLQDVFREKTSQAWLALIHEVDIPGGPINTVDQVFEHPQLKFREILTEVAHPSAGAVKLVRSPMNLSRTPLETRDPPPMLGEHTEEILTALLGYGAEAVQGLRERGVV